MRFMDVLSMFIIIMVTIFMLIIGIPLVVASVINKFTVFAVYNTLAVLSSIGLLSVCIKIMVLRNFPKLPPRGKGSEVEKLEETLPFVCDKCGRRFKTSRALGGHKSYHSRRK